MKISMTEQERVTFKYRLLLNKGDCMGRFDCIYMYPVVYRPTKYQRFYYEKLIIFFASVNPHDPRRHYRHQNVITIFDSINPV